MHNFDSPTTEIVMCPSRKRFLMVSPSSLAIWQYNKLDFEPEMFFHVPKEHKHNIFFAHGIWMGQNQLALLTYSGSILLFDVAKQFRVIGQLMASERNRYTSIASYDVFVIASDEEGNINILSSEETKKISFKVASSCIKSILMSKKYGMFFTDDLTVSSFKSSNKMLSDPKYDIRVKSYNARPAIIALSSCYAAIYDPSGSLVLIEFNFEQKTLSQIPIVFAMSFSPDGEYLFLLCYKQIGLYSFQSNTLKYYDAEEITDGKSIVISDYYVIASTTKGLITYPIYSLSNGIIKGPNEIKEIVQTSSGCAAMSYLFDDLIEYVAPDLIKKYIAVSINSNICIVSRKSCFKYFPRHQSICVKGLAWFNLDLVVLNLNKLTKVLSLYLFKLTKENLTLEKTISLSQFPNHINYTDSFLCLTFKQSVVTINKNFDMKTYFLERNLRSSYITDNCIFVLLKDNCLVKIVSEDCCKTIETEISSFFIEKNYIFITKKNKVLYTYHDRIDFKMLVYASDTIVDVNSNTSSILTINSTDIDEKPSFIPYFNLFGISNKDETKMNIQKLMRFDNYQQIIIQIAGNALKVHQGKECVNFLRLFPEKFDENIISILRSSEKEEREYICNELGSISTIFKSIAGVTCQNYKFVDDLSKTQNKGKIASLLLPVLLEEEGPLVAFPAALYFINNNHESMNDIRPYLHFLEPLLVDPLKNKDESCTCVGMVLLENEYLRIKEILDETVDRCMIDMLLNFKLDVLLDFADVFNISITNFLKNHHKIENCFSLADLVDRCRKIEIEIPRLKLLISCLIKNKWINWASALLKCTNIIDELEISEDVRTVISQKLRIL